LDNNDIDLFRIIKTKLKFYVLFFTRRLKDHPHIAYQRSVLRKSFLQKYEMMKKDKKEVKKDGL